MSPWKRIRRDLCGLLGGDLLAYLRWKREFRAAVREGRPVPPLRFKP